MQTASEKGREECLLLLLKDCLDHAVRMSWPYWDCGDCSHKLDQGARPEMKLVGGDSIGHYDLRLKPRASAAVFRAGSEC